MGAELLRLGARSVITINNRADLGSRRLSDGHLLLNMDARALEFPDGEFDIVLGIAVLEHLLDLDRVLAEIFRVLARNGGAYLHGGPLWSCGRGHHVWVQADGVKYEFNANNPVPDWSHLILDRDEMKSCLEERRIPAAHARKIVEWIYDDPRLNR